MRRAAVKLFAFGLLHAFSAWRRQAREWRRQVELQEVEARHADELKRRLSLARTASEAELAQRDAEAEKKQRALEQRACARMCVEPSW